MKFLTLAVLALSFSAIANTRIEVLPTRPVDCKVESAPAINWVYEIETISETASELNVELKTSVGSCEAGQIYREDLVPRLAGIEVIRNEILLPFQREGVKARLVSVDRDEAVVSLRFDKKVLFKKSNEKSLMMTFHPGGYRPMKIGDRVEWGSADFEWRIELAMDPVTKLVKLSFL